MKKQRGRGTPASLSREPAGQLQAGEVGGSLKSAEPGLRETPGLWEATFDAITDLVSIIDKDFRIIKVNQAFAQALKKTPQELLGRKCYETIHSSTEPWKSCPHKQALQSGKSVTEEFWEPHLEKYVQVSVSPLLNRQKEMIGSVHIIKDITDRKNAEDTLRQSEQRFRLTFDQSPVGAALLDAKDGHFARTNEAFCRFTGYSKEELAQLTFRDITYPDDMAVSVEQTRLLLAGEIHRFEMEKRYVRKDGSTAWGHLSVQLVTGHSGQILYTLATIQDITERREAEEALRRSEEAALRLAQETGIIAAIGRVINSSLDIEEVYERFAEEVRKLIPFDRILVILANKQEGTLTTAYVAGMDVAGNKKGAVFPIRGSVAEAMMRTGAPVLFHSESVEEVHSRFPRLVFAFQAGLRSRLSVLLIARGEVIGSLALWSKQPKAYGDRDIRLAQGVASQIAGAIANAQLFHERKRAEEALRESEESYRSLVETSPDAIFLHEEGRFVYLNPAAVRLYGAGSAEELYGKNAFDIVHPDDREAILKRTGFVMTTGAPVPLKEIRIVRGDGLTVDVEATAGVSYYRGKKVIQVIQRDITERKQAEKELQKERQTFFTILENNPGGVALVDKGGVYQYVNPEFTKITGYALEDVPTGKRWMEKAYPDPHYRQNVIDTWKADRLTSRRVVDRGFTVTCKDGQKKEVEFRTTSLTDYSVIVLNDVTERKRAEEKIRASLREKEVLLKEIHHRVKNNLQIISSLLYLQATRTEHAGAVSALRESRNRIKSMALIHERLYASPDLASVDMGKYTRSLVSDLKQSHMAEDGLIRLRLNLEDIPLGITEAIPSGLIINELVSNALKHAFPKGREGEITIRLHRAGARQITLTVADNGIGFPEHLDFRKSPSLGLTLINSLVEQLDGTIQLDRTNGTAFTITFG